MEIDGQNIVKFYLQMLVMNIMSKNTQVHCNFY